jgi:two-component sensor histidine kinase
MKYGALSAPSGSVSIQWSLTEGGKCFALEWKEAGGPSVEQPKAEGFGGKVIRHAVAHEPNGRIALDYQPDGLRCTMAFDIHKEPAL